MLTPTGTAGGTAAQAQRLEKTGAKGFLAANGEACLQVLRLLLLENTNSGLPGIGGLSNQYIWQECEALLKPDMGEGPAWHSAVVASAAVLCIVVCACDASRQAPRHQHQHCCINGLHPLP